MLTVKSSYSDEDIAAVVQTHIAPGVLPIFPLPVTASLSRRLFIDSLTEGSISINTGSQPSVSLNVTSPTPFDFTLRHQPGPKLPREKAGSSSGFGIGSRYWSCGMALAGLSSHLKVELGLNFSEIASQAKVVIEYGFTGLALMLTGAWKGESSEITTSVGLNYQGVIMKLEYVYTY